MTGRKTTLEPSPPLSLWLGYPESGWHFQEAQPGGRILDSRGKDISLRELPAKNLEIFSMGERGFFQAWRSRSGLRLWLTLSQASNYEASYSTMPTAPTPRHIQKTWKDWQRMLLQHLLSIYPRALVHCHLSVFLLQVFCFWRFETCRIVWWGFGVASPRTWHNFWGPEESSVCSPFLWFRSDSLEPNSFPAKLGYCWKQASLTRGRPVCIFQWWLKEWSRCFFTSPFCSWSVEMQVGAIFSGSATERKQNKTIPFPVSSWEKKNTSKYKLSEIMPFAALWMDLEIIILSEVSQTEKDKHHKISLICGI